MARRSPENPSQLAFDLKVRPEREPVPAPLYRIEPGALGQVDSREVELGRFVRAVDADISVTTPQIAARFLMEQIYAPFDIFEQEELTALMLNMKHRITHAAMIYRGTINEVHIRPAEIFRPAIRVNALALILAHNHPSGDPSPSTFDARFSENIVRAGELLDIRVLDHIVVGRDAWISMKERKLGFS